MQQYYNLQEAAEILQMTPDALREMAKKKEVRAFQDRGTWKFRVQDIDELARSRGLGDSDPELQINDDATRVAPRKAIPKAGQAKPKPADDDRLAVDFSMDDEVPLGREKPSEGPRSSKSSASRSKLTAPGSDSDVRLVLDGDMDFDFDSDVRLDEAAKSNPKAGPKSSASKKKGGEDVVRLVSPDDSSDSDVKVAANKPSSSDSDIRLDGSGKSRGREAGIVTEEIDLDAEEEKARESAVKPRKPRMTQHHSAQQQKPSPFELSEPDVDLDPPPAKAKGKSKPKKPTDSSDDFEAIPFDSAKSSKNLGAVAKAALGGKDLGSGDIPLLDDDEVTLGGDISAGKGNSGINLNDPADSGISLEGSDDEIEFELSLDAGSTPKPGKSQAKQQLATDDSSSEFELSLDDSSGELSDSEFELSLDDESGGSEALSDSGSDSEFELTLDDEGGLSGGDEDSDVLGQTNFEVPSLEDDDSGSEAVALDEGDTDVEDSDFELSLDDSSVSEGSPDSQVVSLEEGEDADDAGETIAKPRKGAANKPAKGGKPAKPAKSLVESQEDIVLDSEEGDSADFNLDESAPRPKPKKGAKTDEDDDDVPSLDEDEEPQETPGPMVAAPAEWGAFPAVMLFPTVAIMFVVALMGFELSRSMWGYQKGTRVATPIVDTLSKLGDK